MPILELRRPTYTYTFGLGNLYEPAVSHAYSGFILGAYTNLAMTA